MNKNGNSAFVLTREVNGHIEYLICGRWIKNDWK